MRTVFDISRNESGLVDRYIGTAYDVVRHVHDNLQYIKQTSFYMESLVNIDNHMAQIAAVQAQLVQLLVVFDNLPMLVALMADVDAYMKALSNYKQTLAGSGGAGAIGTAANNTVQEALDKLAQRLDTTEKSWEDYDQLFKNLQANASYHATTKATATSLAQTLKNGDLVFVHADESLANSPTVYTVAGGGTKTLTLLYNFDGLGVNLKAKMGSTLVGHTNADGSEVTVKAKLDTLSTDVAAKASSTDLAQVKQTADAAAPKTDLATVKQTADAAATKTALAAVKQTADAAATQTDLTALANRVTALENAAGSSGGTA